MVDKPAGVTSHDVVARVRRLAGTRKVGHAGTLDPMATGVLVLGVERATRLLGHLLVTEKAYAATIRLGSATTTDDAEGEVLSVTPAAHVCEEQVLTALGGLVGEIDQVPSAVSAIKVDGRRAYERVRAGEQVELPARRVRIDSIEVHEIRRREAVVDVEVSVRCTSGTYIRAVARDLGDRLGVGGHLTSLRRTSVGPFSLDAARTLAQLQDDFAVLPIGAAARECFASYTLDEAQATDVRFGRQLGLDLGAQKRPAGHPLGPVAVFAPHGEFLALYEQVPPAIGAESAEPLARAVAVFV